MNKPQLEPWKALKAQHDKATLEALKQSLKNGPQSKAVIKKISDIGKAIAEYIREENHSSGMGLRESENLGQGALRRRKRS